MGSENWDQLNDAVAQSRLLNRPLSWTDVVIRCVAGVGLFAALVALHPVVIGVAAV